MDWTNVTEHKITVDVYASWSTTSPRYRVYVDRDLLTERDFVWSGSDTYIREHIIVNLQSGTHSLKIEQVGNTGSIRTKNITVDGVAAKAEFTIE